MNKYSLESALETVFFNQYNQDITHRLGDLSCLYTYYREDDASPKFTEIYNKIQALLLKSQLMEKANRYPSIPTDFRCKFDLPGTNKTPHTFAPVIKMPKHQPLSDYDARIEEIMKIMEKLDIAAMVEYVRKKAIKAGDLKFEK